MSAFETARCKHPLCALLGVLALFAAAVSCRETTATVNTDDYVGQYPLAQVDGHPIGWYHQLNGVNCRAAFTVGTLSMSADKEWRIHLEYDYRCLGGVSGDGNAQLTVYGTVVRSTPELIVLNGSGPDPVFGGGMAWTIEVRPLGDFVEVRFTDSAREYWADPILTMGPRESLSLIADR